MQRYKNFLKNLNLLLNFNLNETLTLTQLIFTAKKNNLLIRISVGFFSSQNYTCHSTLFQFILPVIFILKNVRNFTEVCLHKVDRKTMYLIHDEIKTLRPLLSQGYRATTRRQFTFYHPVPRSSWHSTD